MIRQVLATAGGISIPQPRPVARFQCCATVLPSFSSWPVFPHPKPAPAC